MDNGRLVRGPAPGRPRIAVAIMVHPSRRRNVRRIVRTCAPLPVEVVEDPDPAAGPNPLRTARVAWAAARAEATHHLVLQDDVVLADAFAPHLEDLVARWPGHAIALYVNWNSPFNSYRVRCAALTGRPWALLVPWEWVPTLGLVLPAQLARGLAAYLQTLPASCTEDDDAVARFCAALGVPVLAAVPHLLEHGQGPSVAGRPGARHATVTAGLPPPGTDYWHNPILPYDHGRRRGAAVSVVASACYVRHWALDGERSLASAPYAWTRWSQRCDLLEVPRDLIVSTFADRVRPAARGTTDRDRVSRVALEFWAAGFMLGAEAGRAIGHAAGPQPAAAVRDDVVRTWVRSGLDEHDAQTLGSVTLRRLAQWCGEAVEQGHRFGARSRRPDDR
jgi:hypothetical protein